MRVFGVHLGQPSSSELEQLHSDAVSASLTYDHVGATLSVGQRRPSETLRTLSLGQGDKVFARAGEGLRRWVPQKGLGAAVFPDDVPISVGETLLVVLRFGPLAVVVPDRIVAVVDEPDRFGFAYGTVEGHAERGEESFLIQRESNGDVDVTIRVDAVPATLPARLAGPAVLWIQRWALGRYLQAIEDHVAGT